MSECYPFTSIVGVAELGFDVERPRYKRQPKGIPTTQSHPLRAAACDRLIAALACLENADPRCTSAVTTPQPGCSTSLRH